MDEQPSRMEQARRLLFGLLIIGGAIAVAVLLLVPVVKSLFSNAQVAGPIVAASVALIVFAAGEIFTRRRAAQQYRWDKIADDYERFVALVREGTANQGGELTAEQTEFMGRFSDKLMLWGSPDVIRAWRGVKQAADADLDPTQAMLRYARVLIAIRRDLGHSDRSLDVRDLLGVVINDIDENLPPGTKP
jgi:hypothetical protein